MNIVVLPKAEPTFEQLRERWPVKWRGDRQRGQRLWDEITSPEGCHTKVKVFDTQTYEDRHWIAGSQELYDCSIRYLEECRNGFDDLGNHRYEYLAHLDNMLNRGLWDRFRD